MARRRSALILLALLDARRRARAERERRRDVLCDEYVAAILGADLREGSPPESRPIP